MSMKNSIYKMWSDNKSFIVFLALMFIFRSAIADWNEVPTGSMKPTIVEGDRIWVNKMAYDIRFPFTHISLIKRGDPQRGDIIVFDSKAAGKRLVKRVIGVPGDRVAMIDNVLYINGEKLLYQEIGSVAGSVDRVERLPGAAYTIRVEKNASAMSSFYPVNVPDGAYLALGDNRDNSADSRVIGFVPRDEIVGRTRSVVLSLNYDNYYLPRSDRHFQAL